MPLVSNALEHGASDQPIRVQVEAQPAVLVLSVTNDDKPIADELIPALFLPSRRGPNRGARTGLGLGPYIVSEIVRAHGGDITVRSARDAGTTFACRLPRVGEAPASHALSGTS